MKKSSHKFSLNKLPSALPLSTNDQRLINRNKPGKHPKTVAFATARRVRSCREGITYKSLLAEMFQIS